MIIDMDNWIRSPDSQHHCRYIAAGCGTDATAALFYLEVYFKKSAFSLVVRGNAMLSEHLVLFSTLCCCFDLGGNVVLNVCIEQFISLCCCCLLEGGRIKDSNAICKRDQGPCAQGQWHSLDLRQ